MSRDQGPQYMQRCEPPCPGCQTPWTCQFGQNDWQGIEMYDPAMPTPFELIDAAATWLFAYRRAIVAVCAAAGFSIGVCFAYFF